MGSKQTPASKGAINSHARETIKRIAYEHGMSYEEALAYYMRNSD